MKWLWMNGWAIDAHSTYESVSSLWPEIEHIVLDPTAKNIQKAEESGADHIIGYSLGAYLLLQSPLIQQASEKISLLAPFPSYPAESEMGGKINMRQLLFLKRWLQKNPIEAINDFYLRAQIDLPAITELPYPLEDLLWGLDQLMQSPRETDLLYTCRAIAGAEDRLLDFSQIQKYFTQIQILPETGHGLDKLLEKLKEQHP